MRKSRYTEEQITNFLCGNVPSSWIDVRHSCVLGRPSVEKHRQGDQGHGKRHAGSKNVKTSAARTFVALPAASVRKSGDITLLIIPISV